MTFAGVAATVKSAADTQLVASVPPGAGAGPIGVTTPNGSATSDVPFIITVAATPGITAVSPDVGSSGRAVTIAGTGFDALPTNNNVIFNLTLARIITASGTTLEVEVPAAAGSGRITVITPSGKAVSGEDFFIPPSPRTPEDVGFTGRIASGGSGVVTIDTAETIGLVVFDGTAEESVNLGVTDVSFDGGTPVIELTLISPHGTVLASKLVVGSGASVDPGPLPQSGSYTIVVDPESAPVRAVFTLSQPVADSMAIDGPPLPVSLNKPGQNARVTFPGTAGQRVDLGVSDVNFAGASGALEVSIVDPNGATLASRIVSTSGRGLHPDPLPDPGSYTIVVDPQDSKPVSVSLTLSAPVTGKVTVNGPPLHVTLRPGQTARPTFEGAAGQQITVEVTEVSFGTGNHAVISMLRPDGTTLVSKTVGTIGGNLQPPPLLDSGTYTIVVDPQASSLNPGATTARLTLAVSR